MALRLIGVGDLYIGGTNQFLDGSYLSAAREDPSTTFDLAKALIATADIRFGNLEAPIATGGEREPSRTTSFMCPPATVDALVAGGFNVLSIANNHSMDYGPSALIETMDFLDSASIKYVGGGRNMEEARQPTHMNAGGLNVALLGCASNINQARKFMARQDSAGLVPIRVSPYLPGDQLNQQDIRALLASVTAAREASDLVIVSCHWGVSDGGTQTIAVHQTALGHALIDAGATLVLGHHPHIPQAIELYAGGAICYSLGNFVFDTNKTLPQETIAVSVDLSAHSVERIQVHPAKWDSAGQPYFCGWDVPEYKSIGAEVSALCAEVGTDLVDNGEAWEVSMVS